VLTMADGPPVMSGDRAFVPAWGAEPGLASIEVFDRNGWKRVGRIRALQNTETGDERTVSSIAFAGGRLFAALVYRFDRYGNESHYKNLMVFDGETLAPIGAIEIPENGAKLVGGETTLGICSISVGMDHECHAIDAQSLAAVDVKLDY